MALLAHKGAIEQARPSTKGFHSRLFVVKKASGDWRPVIDLSHLNNYVKLTKFKMETPRSVLSAIRENDWMISIDLKDAYLQIPIHKGSRHLLRFPHQGRVWQFKALPFGLSSAPQTFTRVMTPIAAHLHKLGYRLLRYLDDWLILAQSREGALEARDITLSLCKELGVVVNLEKSDLHPSQEVTYLGMRINSTTFTASPTLKRIDTFTQIVDEFTSCRNPPVTLWRSLLGHMSSFTALVQNSRLRTRSLQIALREQWNYRDTSQTAVWNEECKRDLDWWRDEVRLTQGIPLSKEIPQESLWTDASDIGWGAHLRDQFISGIWSPQERLLQINWRELRAIGLALQHFQHTLVNKVVAVHSDNTSALAYLQKEGGTVSGTLNAEAQRILRWTERANISLRPQFVMGEKNVLADILSRSDKVIGSEWTLHQEVVNELIHKWPANIDLFATALNYRLPNYFSPVPDGQAIAVDALLQNWDNIQGYAFPPTAIIRKVINHLRESTGTTVTLIAPHWPQKEWFPDLMELSIDRPIQLPLRHDLLKQPHFARYHQGIHKLQLHAWRLSSDKLGHRASPVEWQH